MKVTESHTLPEHDDAKDGADAAATSPALTIAWCADEPWRVGEVALLPHGDPGAVRLIGRGESDGDESRATFARARPASYEPQPGLASPRVSRVQLRVEARGEAHVALENVGRLRMSLNGVATTRAVASVGDVIELGSQLVLCVVPRSNTPQRSGAASFAFGHADAHGIVGESPAAWALRDAIAFVARRPGHVLITGPSGSGKELVARAVHASSSRADRPLVSRNAATFPDSLVDAELFGNAKNYPNAGMPERSGLIGDADGTTLFLDEIGELPPQLQAHLLRVLDAGEYVRLGETRSRRADLRLVGATNRRPDSLKHDFLARFALRIDVTGLDQRRDDVPLLLRHRLRSIAASEPDVARRFAADVHGALEVRVTPQLILALLRRPYTTHARELEAVLWRAIAASTGDAISLAPEDELGAAPAAPAASKSLPSEGGALSPARIQACLDEHNGAIEETWRALGLSSRHVLARYIKRHSLVVRRRLR